MAQHKDLKDQRFEADFKQFLRSDIINEKLRRLVEDKVGTVASKARNADDNDLRHAAIELSVLHSWLVISESTDPEPSQGIKRL